MQHHDTPRRTGTGWTRFTGLALLDRSGSVTPARPASPSPVAPALTHHQIVEIVAPFVRAGHLLDMPASDRAQRRLVFHGAQHRPAGSLSPGDAAQAGRGWHEVLQLDSPRPRYFRLTRTVRDESGVEATLQAAGEMPGDLLALVQTVPLQWHFDADPDFRLARSGSIDRGPQAEVDLRLTEVVARMHSLTLKLWVPSVPHGAAVSASVDLLAHRPTGALPSDLLAVLGWDWSLLQAGPKGWQGSVRLRGDAAGRGRDAETKLRAAARHLAHTLAEPPNRFHERLRSARHRALARHAIPALVGTLLVIELLFVEALRAARGSPLTLVLICIPALLLLLFLWRSERPRITLPPWPRPLPADAWEAAP